MIVGLLDEAQAAGARLALACRVVGLSTRTVERWRRWPERDDQRHGPTKRPGNALTPLEQAQILAVMASPRFVGVPPKQLVPQLADEGLYLGSESTMYRLQRRHGLRAKKRTIERSHVTRSSLVHRATGPNQVWSWDITWLPTVVRGRYFYLYLVMDVWSRRIVGWTIEASESAELAAELIKRICRNEDIDPRGLVLHSDNGRPMRGNTMITTLQWLGIVPSFSRPHVSDDNPYSEALFRTLKHTPAYPRMPFATVDSSAAWVTRFVAWYNGEHRHSAIRYVTPDERHHGREGAVLRQRHRLYKRARRVNPERWTGATRDWSAVGPVVLNPPDQAAA